MTTARSETRKVRVALVGMGFGASFMPIYLHHPDVEGVGIVEPDAGLLAQVGDRYDIERRHKGLEEVLRSDEYDAVHLVTPIPLHAEQAAGVLQSGKHCACTVPMATTLEESAASSGPSGPAARTT